MSPPRRLVGAAAGAALVLARQSIHDGTPLRARGSAPVPWTVAGAPPRRMDIAAHPSIAARTLCERLHSAFRLGRFALGSLVPGGLRENSGREAKEQGASGG